MENQELVEQLKAKMLKGEVNFKYTKKNGEERIATGTLNQEIMGEDNVPKGSEFQKSENAFRYFDTKADGWRSFIKDNLIEIIE